MSPWGIATATGVIVVVGTWAQQATFTKNPQGKAPPQLTFKQAAAAIAYIFVILGLDAASPELASAMAGLVLLTAILEYAVPVFTNLGVVSTSGKPA